MNEQTIAAWWSPRRLMILALMIHLISLPLPYSKGISGSGYLTTSRPSSQQIYDSTGSRTLANDSSYGVQHGVTISEGVAPKNGMQHAPHAVWILLFLLFAFVSLEPKGGFWQKRSGYWLAFVLLLFCGLTVSDVGGQMAVAALAVAGFAAFRQPGKQATVPPTS